MSATISVFPSTKQDVLKKLATRAQNLKETDPQQSIRLHEEIVRSLCREINNRNKTIRVLRQLLLDQLDENKK